MGEKGFAAIGLVAVSVIIILIAGGLITYKYTPPKNNEPVMDSPSPEASVEESASPSASVSATPSVKPTTKPNSTAAVGLVDCVGPDGKHIKLSQKDCDNFRKAWATPTPAAQSSSNNSNNYSQGSYGSSATPTPSSSSVTYSPSCQMNVIPSFSGTAPYNALVSVGGGTGGHGTIAGYQWDYDGNGSWDSGTTSGDYWHVFSSAGSYTVKARLVTSTNEYSNTCSVTITVN
jgi:hypothetical protein